MVQIFYYQLSWHLMLVLRMEPSEILLLTSLMMMLWRGQRGLTSLVQHHHVPINVLMPCLLLPSWTMIVSGGGNELIGSTEYQKPVQTCIWHRFNNMLPQMVEPRLYLLEQNILVHRALTKYYYIQSKITRCMGHAVAVQSLYVCIRHPVSLDFTWLLY